MSIKTEVVQALGGNYQVRFSIDHQSFHCEPKEGDEFMTSKEHAEWHQRQLDIAFERLLKGGKTEVEPIESSPLRPADTSPN